MAKVSDILAQKDSRVHVVAPTVTVLQATLIMNHNRIGALVVTLGGQEGEADSNRVVGMFTERDVLMRVVALQRDPASTRVEEVMSSDIVFCTPETDVDDVASMMQKRRIRHVPVCDGEGHLLGLVSIGDVNAWHARGLDVEIHYLHEYIHGRV